MTLVDMIRLAWKNFIQAHQTPTQQAYLAIFVVGCVILVAMAVWLTVTERRRQDEVRRTLMEAAPVSAKEFLENWRIGRRGSGLGYGATDEAGCYVILTNPVYDGSGDVYADVRAGKPVEVRMVRCAPADLNATERSLIAAFDATRSYNRTRGGSKAR